MGESKITDFNSWVYVPLREDGAMLSTFDQSVNERVESDEYVSQTSINKNDGMGGRGVVVAIEYSCCCCYWRWDSDFLCAYEN